MILVEAAPLTRRGERAAAAMAVVLKINPGFDASYPWREIGTAAANPEARSPLEDYLAPADKGGEPPGRGGGRGPSARGGAARAASHPGEVEAPDSPPRHPPDRARRARLRP